MVLTKIRNYLLKISDVTIDEYKQILIKYSPFFYSQFFHSLHRPFSLLKKKAYEIIFYSLYTIENTFSKIFLILFKIKL